jgi:hypothetical protein
MILRDNWRTSFIASRVHNGLKRGREPVILRDNWQTSLTATRVNTYLERGGGGRQEKGGWLHLGQLRNQLKCHKSKH